MCWLLFLLNILALCQSEKVYKNLYGEDSFSDVLINMVGATAGSLEFAREGERFMFAEPPDQTPKSGDKFDFIIVGAGTAGATIASRLSEMPEVRVLLIEAGRSENLAMDIPLLVNYLQFSNDVNWKYRTESSNNYCTGMVDKRCNWPRGKVMGGSSVLNYMIVTRGHPKDYDRWAELGNEGWSWKDVLPYFKKLETMEVPKYKSNTKSHNNNGPVYINYPPFHTPLADAFLKGGIELGYKIVDYNSGSEPVGFSYIQANIKNGTRVSSSVAYLHRAKYRTNLVVTKNSLASKILFDPNNKRAVGIEYIKANKRYRVYVTKEVIISAGTIGTAQLLMLSGIGPAEHLKEMNINPIVNLAVGENLMDHIAYGGLIFLVDQPVGIRVEDMANPVNPYMRDYFMYRKGPLTIPGACEALAFIDVDNPNDQSAYPNVELLFVSSSIASVPAVHYGMGIAEDVWQETFVEIENSFTWTVFPMLLRPKSRGKILLRNNNINSKPRIIPNYMAHKEDVRILVEGIKATLKVANTTAMQKFGTKLFPAQFEVCKGKKLYSDEYWECATRAITMNIYHYSGTCKMGPSDDPTAVVDAQLKVHGIKGLRIADASIMPEIMSGHTNIPVFMIAEKLSDMIKKEWGYATS